MTIQGSYIYIPWTNMHIYNSMDFLSRPFSVILLAQARFICINIDMFEYTYIHLNVFIQV